jgi:hypothetical protein
MQADAARGDKAMPCLYKQPQFLIFNFDFLLFS